MRYALVIVDVLNQDVDKIFTYAIPEALNIEIGMRVLVPFGRQGNIEGVVISLVNETDVPFDKIKFIHSCLDETPSINEEQIHLAKWIKKQYHTTMADALRLFIPAQVRSGKAKTKYIQMIKLSASKEQTDVVLGSLKPGSKAHRIISVLSEYGDMEKSRLNQIVSGCYEPLKKLKLQGFIEEYQEEAVRSPYLDIAPDKAPWLNLNRKQAEVLQEILDNQNKFAPFCFTVLQVAAKLKFICRQ